MNGAGNRIRTGDPNLGKVVLYQLSYSRPKSKKQLTLLQPRCQAYFFDYSFGDLPKIKRTEKFSGRIT